MVLVSYTNYQNLINSRLFSVKKTFQFILKTHFPKPKTLSSSSSLVKLVRTQRLTRQTYFLAHITTFLNIWWSPIPAKEGQFSLKWRLVKIIEEYESTNHHVTGALYFVFGEKYFSESLSIKDVTFEIQRHSTCLDFSIKLTINSEPLKKKII